MRWPERVLVWASHLRLVALAPSVAEKEKVSSLPSRDCQRLRAIFDRTWQPFASHRRKSRACFAGLGLGLAKIGPAWAKQGESERLCGDVEQILRCLGAVARQLESPSLGLAPQCAGGWNTVDIDSRLSTCPELWSDPPDHCTADSISPVLDHGRPVARRPEPGCSSHRRHSRARAPLRDGFSPWGDSGKRGNPPTSAAGSSVGAGQRSVRSRLAQGLSSRCFGKRRRRWTRRSAACFGLGTESLSLPTADAFRPGCLIEASCEVALF